MNDELRNRNNYQTKEARFKRRQKKQANNKGRFYAIKSNMNVGKLIAFESLLDSSDIAYRFTKQVQESNPKLRVFYMKFPNYFEIEKAAEKFIDSLNSIVIENNAKYFIDDNVKRTIDNMLEHQKNERLNKFMGINYIHMLPILSRIDKLNFLHTHYNLIVVSNYFNSIKAFASINKHIFRCLKFVYEQYIPKADHTFYIDINNNDLKNEVNKIGYDYFYEDYADKYRLTMMNGLFNKRLKNKVTTVPFNPDDKNKIVFECLTKFNLFMKYVTKTKFE